METLTAGPASAGRYREPGENDQQESPIGLQKAADEDDEDGEEGGDADAHHRKITSVGNRGEALRLRVRTVLQVSCGTHLPPRIRTLIFRRSETPNICVSSPPLLS